jgi:hypothetical protein
MRRSCERSEYSIAEIGTVTMGLITEPPPGAKRGVRDAACPVGIPDPNVDCWLLDEELKPVLNRFQPY